MCKFTSTVKKHGNSITACSLRNEFNLAKLVRCPRFNFDEKSVNRPICTFYAGEKYSLETDICVRACAFTISDGDTKSFNLRYLLRSDDIRFTSFAQNSFKLKA